MFISFEGHDASGKTTLIENVGKVLSSRGFSVSIVKEFSESRYGRYLLSALSQDKFLRADTEHKSILTQVFAILNDWIYLTEYEIAPLLDEGRLVLKDRHVHSVIACQLPSIVNEYGLDADQVLDWYVDVVTDRSNPTGHYLFSRCTSRRSNSTNSEP